MAGSERRIGIKTVSFLWVPDNLQLRWANTPEEVPIWDHSRGVPLGHNLYWARGFLDLEDEAEIIRCFRQKLENDAWTPSAAPARGYPRLVRVSPFDVGRMDIPNPNRLIDDISGLVRNREDPFDFSVSKRLQNEILALCQKYGPLTELDNLSGSTYDEWLSHAYTVAAHKEVLDAMKTLGYAELPTYLEDKDGQWRDDLYNSLSSPYNPASPYRILSFALKPDERAFRDEMVRQCLQYLSYEARTEIALNLGKTIYHVPISKWLWFELAELWLGTRKLKTCEGCGRLFVARNKKAKVCHERCRVRKRAREKALLSS